MPLSRSRSTYEVRMAVPREKFLDAQRALGVARSDQHRVALSVLHELEPAQDERAHQDLAELRVGLDERTKALAIQLDTSPAARIPAANHIAAAREQCTSPLNWPGPCGDDLLGRAVFADDFDGPESTTKNDRASAPCS